ncbi:MAG: FCD domain-containing protein, partial [Clostridiales bacterium]|nr:FCD domain-containing protein [Clostridiales bacterium]
KELYFSGNPVSTEMHFKAREEHAPKESRLGKLEENIYLSDFHARRGHSEQLAELDNQFHEILYAACDSKMLEHLLKDFHQYVLRVRKKNLSVEKRGLDSNDEHKKIMEAIRDKDADRAEALANQHIVNAYQSMVDRGFEKTYTNSLEDGNE